MPITTRFSAVVDGTNGNVWLQPVHAQLGESSRVAEGGIVELEGQLDGSFEIDSARFSKGGPQAKMNELSQKAKGDAYADEPPDRVASDFSGRFAMKGGVIRFSSLTFAVPSGKLDPTGFSAK